MRSVTADDGAAAAATGVAPLPRASLTTFGLALTTSAVSAALRPSPSPSSTRRAAYARLTTSGEAFRASARRAEASSSAATRAASMASFRWRAASRCFASSAARLASRLSRAASSAALTSAARRSRW